MKLSGSILSPLFYKAATEDLRQTLGSFLHKKDWFIINTSGLAISKELSFRRFDVIASRLKEQLSSIFMIKSLTYSLEKPGLERKTYSRY